VSAEQRVPVRLVFADRGSFYELDIDLPADLLARHSRIIDALREETAVTSTMYVDLRRLVAAHVLPNESPEEL
jgi:hypothetical protein